MRITDMLLGHKRLTDMGFSPEAIKIALSSRAFSCESEVIEACRQAEADLNPPDSQLPKE